MIASISEHQPTTWATFFFDLNILTAIVPAGIIRCLRRRSDGDLFLGVFAVTSVYFAAVMIRLMLTVAPLMCIFGGISIAALLNSLTERDQPPAPQETQSSRSTESVVRLHATLEKGNVIRPMNEVAPMSGSSNAVLNDRAGPFTKVQYDHFRAANNLLVRLVTVMMLTMYVLHCTWVAITTYSSPSIILSSMDPKTRNLTIVDDYREAYSWLRFNTAPDAKILAWWDYGYQISGMADRHTIVDNNTWSTPHIATVGLALCLPEKEAYPVIRQLGANYIMVVCGAVLQYIGDDLSKMLWIARIAANEFPDRLNVDTFLGKDGQFRTDPRSASPAVMNSVLYRAIYGGHISRVSNMDLARNYPIPIEGSLPLKSLVEVYSTTMHMVRIYKVRDPDPLGRSFFE